MGNNTIKDENQLERIRLHITPFNADLLDRIIPPSLRPVVSNISYHALQTLPERGFGYLELPAMEANKLKKKLHGSTLKGTKVRVEEAKPEKKRRRSAEAESDDEKSQKRLKRERRKKEVGVLPGYELDQGRRVKRGWTGDDAKNKKPQISSSAPTSSNNGKKLRFKTVIPPNLAPAGSKSSTQSREKKPKARKAGGQEVVVHEFAKASKIAPVTVQPKTRQGTTTAFEDGTGWVDGEGNVVETEPNTIRRKKSASREGDGVNDDRLDEAVSMPGIASSSPNGLGVGGLADDEGFRSDNVSEPPFESYIDDSNWTHAEVQSGDPPVTPTQENLNEPAPEAIESEQPENVHPLEALFKRTASKPSSPVKSKPGPIDTSFSFFNSSDADEQENHDVGHPPQTPHTKQDLEWRSIRSAAPTPDTAALGKRFSFPFGPDEDEDGEDGDDTHAGDEERSDAEPEQSDAADGTSSGRQEESEFRKWFYDNRGDLNRGWKKRRREERKAKRQRENRRLSRRVV